MVKFGRLEMSLAIAIYTFIPPIVDLITDTHVFNADWMPHARMHTVWLLGVTFGIGLIALYLLWSNGPDNGFRINLSGILSLIVLGAFYLSASTTSLYGGSMNDIPDDLYKGPAAIDANLLIFSIATILLLMGWRWCIRRQK